MWPEGIFFLSFPSLPSFSASVLKGFSPPVSWIFCKLRENVLGLKTQSQRHRLLQAPHRDLSASLWDCSRASATHKTVLHPKLSCNVSFWPMLQWEQGGTCHWNFWGASTGPSGCFPFMNTEYPQIQVWSAFWALVVSNPIHVYFLS